MRTLLSAGLIVSLMACGGVAASIDGDGGAGDDGGAGRDSGIANDADLSPDAAIQTVDAGASGDYLACMTDGGQILSTMKACASDDDCTIKQEGLDCCGSMRYVGISKSEASAFDVCVAAWDGHVHYGMCDCAAGAATTEDGKIVTDPSLVEVQCSVVGVSGECATYQP